ncbi:MAG: hypothetical protein AAF965_14860 [Pseudomonadota bacterium]
MTLPASLPDDERTALLRHLGPHLAHVTARRNLDSIFSHGLRPTVELAALTDTACDNLTLRVTRARLRGNGIDATLGHQRPVTDHIGRTAALLEDHSPHSWAALLNTRVFFWPGGREKSFGHHLSRDMRTATLWLDTERLLRACAGRVDLSPINSGNFARGGGKARRGDWLFVPSVAGLAAFRANRQKRGYVRGRDTVAEISVRGALSPSLLQHLLTEIA